MTAPSSIPDDLIELIYDTALRPERWPELLVELDRQVADLAPGGGEAAESALSRHLERAVGIAERMAESEEHADLLGATLNQLPLAALLVDERAGVIASNRLARELDARQSLFSLTEQRLKPIFPQARRQLLSALQRGADDRTPDSIALSDERVQLSIKVVPIEETAQRRYTNVCLVLIAEMGANRQVSTGHLIATYGLTKAEARLTCGLVAGDELKSLALQFGVSYNTVRSQLRSVLGKLGLQRQNELVAKILSDPLATLRSAPDAPAIPDFNAIVLPDGRKLAWCEYGPADGQPVLVSHASLWSRLQRHPDDSLLERYRIRLIVPDRPGYGRSDPLPGRTLLGWADDAAALMDHLGIARFSVVGIMLGGDYALTVAAALPQRVTQVVLLGSRVSQVLCRDCPPGPRAVRVLERLSVTYPRLLTTALQSVFREMLRKPDTFVTKVLPVIGPKDREVWEQGELQPLFLAAFREANRQGMARAIVDDWAVLTAPWPFAPEDIEVPVTIWHGRHDSLCPVEHIEHLAQRLPNAGLHVVEDGNSYVFVHQWEDALRHLASTTAPA